MAVGGVGPLAERGNTALELGGLPRPEQRVPRVEPRAALPAYDTKRVDVEACAVSASPPFPPPPLSTSAPGRAACPSRRGRRSGTAAAATSRNRRPTSPRRAQQVERLEVAVGGAHRAVRNAIPAITPCSGVQTRSGGSGGAVDAVPRVEERVHVRLAALHHEAHERWRDAAADELDNVRVAARGEALGLGEEEARKLERQGHHHLLDGDGLPKQRRLRHHRRGAAPNLVPHTSWRGSMIRARRRPAGRRALREERHAVQLGLRAARVAEEAGEAGGHPEARVALEHP